jgi:prophage regulatory protein
MQPPELIPGTVVDEALTVAAPLLLNATSAAATCGKSLRTWRSWDAAGLIPRPIRIGRSTLWRADELRAWVAAGCPRRQEWERSRKI